MTKEQVKNIIRTKDFNGLLALYSMEIAEAYAAKAELERTLKELAEANKEISALICELEMRKAMNNWKETEYGH